jgi:hypothetical protein
VGYQLLKLLARVFEWSNLVLQEVDNCIDVQNLFTLFLSSSFDFTHYGVNINVSSFFFFFLFFSFFFI